MPEEFKLPHKLTLTERSALTMTGVTEVVCFDDEAVILRTELGRLNIHGKALKLRNLSLEGGQVAVDGQISALFYEEPKPAGGWIRRLLG